MTPRVSDLIEIIDTIAPFQTAEEWDNVGLQVGDPSAPVQKILVALDAGEDTVDAAIAAGCQILITHHPLIFRPLSRLNLHEPSGALIGKIISARLNVVSLHTNFDVAPGGMNDILAARLGVTSSEPLLARRSQSLVKLAVFVPKGFEEQVLSALFRFSGFIGNYSECSFQANGTGTFKALEGANPFVGDIGKREYADETRVEVLLRGEDVREAVNALKVSHPYEEPAFDLYPLLNEGEKLGLGRIGRLAQPVTLEEYVCQLKSDFPVEGLRYVGDGARVIETVALCGGSGASLLQEAVHRGADVLVTGDIKYHDARDAQMAGIALVDLGHFASEILMIEGCAARLGMEMERRGLTAEIVTCGVETDPFRYR